MYEIPSMWFDRMVKVEQKLPTSKTKVFRKLGKLKKGKNLLLIVNSIGDCYVTNDSISSVHLTLRGYCTYYFLSFKDIIDTRIIHGKEKYFLRKYLIACNRKHDPESQVYINRYKTAMEYDWGFLDNRFKRVSA